MEIELAETFETHRYKITHSFNTEPFYIIPFGDVHRFSPNCAEDRWHEFLEWAKKKKNCYFFGMGDYFDLASASERRLLENPDLHESTRSTLEEIYENFVEQFAKEIGFMRGKLIGMLEGNHHVKFLNGMTSTQLLCHKMACKYLGNVAFVRVGIHHTSKGGGSLGLTIFAAHGISIGGRTVFGGMNAVEKMEPIAEADLYLQGHNHQKGALPFARLHLQEGQAGEIKVVQRKGFFIRTGSFLRGYLPTRQSYVSDKLLRPTDLGVVKVEITPRRIHHRGVDNYHIDIHASI